jgi:hypothetical protein
MWIDEPDDFSYDSASLPGAETLRKDWMANCRQSRARRLKMQEEQEQREELSLEKQIEEVFANDGKSEKCSGSEILGISMLFARHLSLVCSHHMDRCTARR